MLVLVRLLFCFGFGLGVLGLMFLDGTQPMTSFYSQKDYKFESLTGILNKIKTLTKLRRSDGPYTTSIRNGSARRLRKIMLLLVFTLESGK